VGAHACQNLLIANPVYMPVGYAVVDITLQHLLVFCVHLDTKFGTVAFAIAAHTFASLVSLLSAHGEDILMFRGLGS
jgi:hypothetical protein